MSADLRITQGGDHVEVVAVTAVVDVPFMIGLIDRMAEVPALTTCRRVLLEVIAPACRVSLIDRVDIWSHALRRELFGLRIAHVITGRPVGADEIFKENYAWNRGILVRTFTERGLAQAWLEAGRGA